MGLYDYIRCLAPLPETPAPPKNRTFQTKDAQAAPYMENFTITEDGRLIHHTVTYETVAKEERSFPDAPDDSLLAMVGSMKAVPAGDVEVPFNGDISFYQYDHTTREWWEYTATFVDGKLSKLWLSDHQK